MTLMSTCARLMLLLLAGMQPCGCGPSGSSAKFFRATSLDRWLIPAPAGSRGAQNRKDGHASARSRERRAAPATRPRHESADDGCQRQRTGRPPACLQAIAHLLLKAVREGDEKAVQRILQSQAVDVNTPLRAQGMTRAVTLLEVAEEEENAALCSLLVSMGARHDPIFDDGDEAIQEGEEEEEEEAVEDNHRDRTHRQDERAKGANMKAESERGWVVGSDGRLRMGDGSRAEG